ncbi:MAG: methyltransferase domain-containing protein [Acidimicrobiia bacterium]|nr:methyltransferase domain-containing protein [Acidimicrobiia bacterium]
MNDEHAQLCSSAQWAEHIQTEVVPWAMDALAPPALLLEIGPGYGAATEVLRQRVQRLVAVEKDPELARRLQDRFAADPVVDVQEGDGTQLPFPDHAFDGATCFTMLHHVPSLELQDRLFTEAARVVRPGGVFFGVDSLGGPAFEAFHHDDVCVAVDPLTLADRLTAAGFDDVDIAVLAMGVRFSGTVPAA